MSFGWLIWALVFLILVGSDSRLWGSIWTGPGYTRLGRSGRLGRSAMDDFELRKLYSKSAEPDMVVVTADDFIENPDQRLEDLISEGKFDEAWRYRGEMEKIAEEMDDDEALRKYAIYGARISGRQKELVREKAVERARTSRAHPVERKERPTVRPREVLEVRETIEHVPSPVGGPAILPPLWKAGAKVEPTEVRRIEIATGPAGIASVESAAGKITTEKPPELAVPVAEPVIPKDFTPPPPGPVQLGVSGSLTAEPPKPDHAGEEEGEDVEEEKIEINPDDYTDLISI